MSKKDNNRLWRLGLAAAATGVGYVYHALSQERSLRSKVIQDGMRIKREANRLTHANSKKQATEDLAKRSINHENLFFITRDQASEIHRGKNGVMVELTGIDSKPALDTRGDSQETDKAWIIYFHGGSGIHTLKEREWAFARKVNDRFGTGADVSIPLLRSFANYDLEAETGRITALIEEIAEKTGRSLENVYFLSSDTGAIPALLVADRMDQIGQPVKRVILLSPWLNTSFDDVNINPNDVQFDATKVNALKTIWRDKNPALNYAKMPIDSMPAVDFINGSDDSHACDGRWLHRRLRAHNHTSNYYQFDYMHHEFYLNNLPESQEVIDIIHQQIMNP